jgi:hypothetical protein
MSSTFWIVLVAGIISVVLLVVAGGRLGWFELKLFGAAVRAGTRETGVTGEKLKAKGNIRLENIGDGGVASLKEAEAGKDIELTNRKA